MLLTARILILLLLVLVAIQDFKSRAVYWIIFPVLMLLFLTVRLSGTDGIVAIALQVSFNIAFIVVQLLVLTLYFTVKNRQWTNLTISMLGWGDILFLGVLAIALSFSLFLLFYLVSLVSSLLLWMAFQACTKWDTTIPLAGLQAAFLICFLITAWIMQWDTSAAPTFLKTIGG